MFINKDSLKLNGVSLGTYILEAKYGYHKLWASDSGRNMAGEQTGTLIGIFPKITVQFKRMNQAELESIAPYLDLAQQTIEYYDPNKKQMTTMTTYSNDWETTSKMIGKIEGFSVAFISKKKRG